MSARTRLWEDPALVNTGKSSRMLDAALDYMTEGRKIVLVAFGSVHVGELKHRFYNRAKLRGVEVERTLVMFCNWNELVDRYDADMVFVDHEAQRRIVAEVLR